MPWVADPNRDGLRLQAPLPFDEQTVLSLIQALQDTNQNNPEGVCDALREGLRNRHMSKDMLFWFSTWCDTNPRPQEAARNVANALFGSYPPRFCDGRAPANWTTRPKGDDNYRQWLDAVLNGPVLRKSENLDGSQKVVRQMPTIKDLLEQFRQVILYGPPGTGKTREALRVAIELLSGSRPPASATPSEIDNHLKPFRIAKRFELVVFHPAYEYEQFVGGIEPTVENKMLAFQVKAGVFLKMCRQTEQSQEPNQPSPSVLVIDEINRGNLPKLLGELVYALEYRDQSVALPFVCDGRGDLIVPKNLYIIATMNSSDRSIGHIDVAIRRRFALYHVGPSPQVIQDIWNGLDATYGRQLAALATRINESLRTGHDPNAEVELGVGHSYFLPVPVSPVDTAKQQVRTKWQHQVQPLLREYAELLNLGDEFFRRFPNDLDSALREP